jgi:hypothetical protein
LAACFGLGSVGSIQTHVRGATFGAVGFGLAGVPTRSVAAGPLRALEAWSGLGGAGGVRPGCGGMSLKGKWGKRSGVSTTIEIFEFFFF